MSSSVPNLSAAAGEEGSLKPGDEDQPPDKAGPASDGKACQWGLFGLTVDEVPLLPPSLSPSPPLQLLSCLRTHFFVLVLLLLPINRPHLFVASCQTDDLEIG